MLSRVIKGAGLAVTEPAQAAELIEQNRPRLESFRAHYLYPTLLCFLAEAQIRLGRADQATTALDQAIARAERSGVRWWDPELHRVRALLARQAGDSATAREELLRAIATAEVQGSEAMRRRAISDLAGVP